MLRKRHHPARSLDDIDPNFYVAYDESKHGKVFQEEFKPSPLLTSDQNAQLASLIKEYWSIFDEKGLFLPVKDYECVIDTGSAAPIAVKGIRYAPRETPVMRECISKLEQLGHISQAHGRWLFKALLAPKPHQEHVTDIAKFKWRFCVNYIPLNAVTCVIAYPIPRCDTAVHEAFGDSVLYWLMDATQGYHQLAVEESSREKLAFQGPDAIKWTYNVMPFGPVNGPSVFITFMHDMAGQWKQLTESRGVTINEDTNSRLIVDDLFSFALNFDTALIYIRSQFQVCLSQNLSLKLGKCCWFPERLEFVGIDITPSGNRPAMSKHQILEHWPVPTLVRDVASFVGFAVFYSQFIPLSEVRVKRLREIMKFEYTDSVLPHWDEAARAEFDDICNALLSDPCNKRFDHRKRLYLLTDFCKDGFGWCASQPGDDSPSLAAMHREMRGGDCEFMLPNANLTLHPVAFGCRRTRGNEVYLHSHLGEGFGVDVAIHKNAHMCFGMQFTLLTDCYALRFLLSYSGYNPPLLRLQMRLMCWDMTIVHRPGSVMTSPDYFSRLGADLCFDPFLRDYIQRIEALKSLDPAPTSLPIQPENMPGYRRKRKSSSPSVVDVSLPPVDPALANLAAAIYADDSHGHAEVLSNIPIHFGCFDGLRPC